MRVTRSLWWLVLTVATGLPASAQQDESERQAREIQRICAVEAHQGVAVGPDSVFAIGTRHIGQYNKQTGRLVGTWAGGDDSSIIHLNSGVVVAGKLYGAHSNYPNLPMTGSIEIWDAATLEHVGQHVFENPPGSCTWIDRHKDRWWVCFAHYSRRGGEPGKDNSATVLVEFDDRWRQVSSWRFPQSVLQRMAPYSCSGGSFGADALLYCTGHDRRELYVLRVPSAGQTLAYVETIPSSNPGQGLAWDRFDDRTPPKLYGIDRQRKQIVAMRISELRK